MKKRRTYEELSVLSYMNRGETYPEAEARLTKLWEDGEHPAQHAAAERQLKRTRRLEERQQRRGVRSA